MSCSSAPKIIRHKSEVDKKIPERENPSNEISNANFNKDNDRSCGRKHNDINIEKKEKYTCILAKENNSNTVQIPWLLKKNLLKDSNTNSNYDLSCETALLPDISSSQRTITPKTQDNLEDFEHLSDIQSPSEFRTKNSNSPKTSCGTSSMFTATTNKCVKNLPACNCASDEQNQFLKTFEELDNPNSSIDHQNLLTLQRQDECCTSAEHAEVSETCGRVPPFPIRPKCSSTNMDLDDEVLFSKKTETVTIFKKNKYSSVIRKSNTKKSLDNKKRIIRMLTVVVLEFFICWSPLYVMNTISLFDPQSVYSLLGTAGVSVIQLIAYCSACCNPITYCFMNKSFRLAFYAAVSCRKNLERHGSFVLQRSTSARQPTERIIEDPGKKRFRETRKDLRTYKDMGFRNKPLKGASKRFGSLREMETTSVVDLNFSNK